jgi:LacI family transcriptional regulator
MSDETEARRVLLGDVARAANVSKATASRALSGDGRISFRTRTSVIKAADELRYVPNVLARSLRVRRTRTLGLLLVDLSDPVHGQVASGFEQEAGERGYRVIFVAALNDPVEERRALKIFAEHGTDGVTVVSGILDPSEAQTLAPRERLIVVQPDHRSMLRRRGPLPAGVIQTDDESGVEAAVKHLLANGFRDIAYVGRGTRASNAVRRDAVARSLKDEGIRGPLRSFKVADDAQQTSDQIAALLTEDLPDAVICYDDMLALVMLDGLRERGIRVPDDMGVVGFDGIPFAAISNPRLTTVVTPSNDLGRLAAASLISAIETGELPPAIVLPVELVARESTRPRGVAVAAAAVAHP